MLPERLRRNRWLMPILVVAAFVLPCRFLPNPNIRSAPRFEDQRFVFHLSGNEWKGVPEIRGGADRLRVSDSGMVCVSSPAHRDLNCLNASRWVRPWPGHIVSGAYALIGNQVWAATAGGIAQFDGQNWRLWPDALDGRWPTIIAAGGSGVWALNTDGDLAHFDGANWKTIKAEAIEESGPDEIDALAVTNDGALWTSGSGVWRFGGSGWREIRPAGLELDEAALLGSGPDGVVWVLAADSLAAIDATGAIVHRYALDSLPIQSMDRSITQVTVGTGRVWAATGGGLLVLENGRWRNMGRPAGTASVREVAAGIHGDVWVVAERRPLSRTIAWIGPILGLIFLISTVSALLIVEWVRGAAENRLAAIDAQGAVTALLPQFQPNVAKAEIRRQVWRLRFGLAAVNVSVPYVIFGLSLVGQRFGPRWITHRGLFAWVPVCMLLAVGWLWTREHKTGITVSRPLGLGCWVVAAILASTESRLWLLAPLALFLLAVPLRDRIAFRITRDRTCAGRREPALRWLRLLSAGRPTKMMDLWEGCILTSMGRLEEAERVLRQALARNAAGTAWMRREILTHLGYVLADLGRLDDAEQCLKWALEMGDPDGAVRHVLADLRLQQGREPERALELGDEALAARKDPYVFGDRLATRAWALAQLGRNEEARAAIQEALSVLSPALPEATSSAHLTIGRAFLAMGLPEEAAEHFQIARDADPNGKHQVMAVAEFEKLAAAQRV